MWPDAENTQELIAAAHEGAESHRAAAVDRLLDRHRDAVRRLVRMRLDQKIQRRIDVSDVVQDVFVEANRRLQEYLASPSMPFHLWLRQIAKDRIIDAHRRHRGSAKRSVDREQVLAGGLDPEESQHDWIGQLRDPELTPAAAVAQKEMTVLVERAISLLDEHDAEILVMRHYEHLSNQEAAQALGLSEPAASMRYLRAVRRLRDLLSQPLPPAPEEKVE